MAQSASSRVWSAYMGLWEAVLCPWVHRRTGKELDEPQQWGFQDSHQISFGWKTAEEDTIFGQL